MSSIGNVLNRFVSDEKHAERNEGIGFAAAAMALMAGLAVTPITTISVFAGSFTGAFRADKKMNPGMSRAQKFRGYAKQLTAGGLIGLMIGVPAEILAKKHDFDIFDPFGVTKNIVEPKARIYNCAPGTSITYTNKSGKLMTLPCK
jgi:hypothetical protein